MSVQRTKVNFKKSFLAFVVLIIVVCISVFTNLRNVEASFGPEEICNNNLDDNGNGIVDCLDSYCVNNAYCSNKPNWIRKNIDNSSGGADGTELFDIDNDGDLDITTAWEQGGSVRLYVNQPGDAWSKVNVCTSGCGNGEDTYMKDLDNDGKTDIISMHENSTSRINVYWNSGNVKSNWIKDFIPASNGKSWMVAEAGLIEGDNKVDIVAGSKEAGAGIYWFKAPSDSRKMADWKMYKIASAKWIMGLKVLDIDNDGDSDVLVTDRDKSVLWYENPGNFAVTKAWVKHTIGTGCKVRWLKIVDVDEDGREDVLVADYCSKTKTFVSWFKKPVDTKKVWEAHRIGTVSTSFSNNVVIKAVDFGDINKDNKKDIVITTVDNPSSVLWFSYNNSIYDANWNSHIVEPTKNKYDEVQLVDLNDDGFLDILTSHEDSGGGVFWYENPFFR